MSVTRYDCTHYLRATGCTGDIPRPNLSYQKRAHVRGINAKLLRIQLITRYYHYKNCSLQISRFYWHASNSIGRGCYSKGLYKSVLNLKDPRPFEKTVQPGGRVIRKQILRMTKHHRSSLVNKQIAYIMDHVICILLLDSNYPC